MSPSRLLKFIKNVIKTFFLHVLHDLRSDVSRVAVQLVEEKGLGLESLVADHKDRVITKEKIL